IVPPETGTANNTAVETHPLSPASAPPSDSSDTQLFTDKKYGYSLRYPATWKREPTASAPGPAVTLFLSTPNHNRLVVSIYPLPSRLERYSSATFDQIGHDHVDTVLSAYRTILKLNKILREQPENHSNDQSMIF